MIEENKSQGYRLQNIDKTRNYSPEEIKQNELISRKNKNVCQTVNYVNRFPL